ncbi:MAG: CdaR family protein [Anaerolineae bacterium]
MAKSGLTSHTLIGNLGLAILALILSLVVWVSATYQNDPPRQGIFAEPIPIELANMPEGLTLTKEPERLVRVRIRAFSSSWAGLTASNFRATADLSGLEPGVHSVPVEVTCSDRTVSLVGAQPETIFVSLEKSVQKPMTITVRLVDQDELPLGYAVNLVDVDEQTITVAGPESAVARVTEVVASVALAGERNDVERVVEPRALDSEGNVVAGVTVRPQQVTAQFSIAKKLNYREVAVRARTSGTPARGYFVSSVNVEPATVTVVGPPDVIATMPGLVSVQGEVDVGGASRLIAERLDLDLPPGVSVLTEGEDEQPTILVTVEIDAVKGGTTLEVPIAVRKLGNGLSAKLSVTSADVILTGPAVMLDDLQIDLLSTYVDLSGLGPGTHQVRTVVDILVSQNPGLSDLAVTSISPAYVEVTITEAPTLTPIVTGAVGPVVRGDVVSQVSRTPVGSAWTTTATPVATLTTS